MRRTLTVGCAFAVAAGRSLGAVTVGVGVTAVGIGVIAVAVTRRAGAGVADAGAAVVFAATSIVGLTAAVGVQVGTSDIVTPAPSLDAMQPVRVRASPLITIETAANNKPRSIGRRALGFPASQGEDIIPDPAHNAQRPYPLPSGFRTCYHPYLDLPVP